MGSESQSLYACVTTSPENGILELISYRDEGSWERDYQVIPVSSDTSLIERFGRNLLNNQRLELKFLDIVPLIKKGVISRERIFNLDNVKQCGGKQN
jgi:hypothetical protein